MKARTSFHSRNLLMLIAVALCLAVIASLHAPAAATAASTESPTQDIVHMNDGRVFPGEIISENRNEIVFHYVDPNLNIQTTLTLSRRDIANIERDVPMEQESRRQGVDTDRQDDGEAASGERARPEGLAQGLAEGAADDEGLPAFYVIPMKGQMGTDIRADVYEEVVREILNDRPDLVVWVLDCTDVDDLMLTQSDDRERGVPIIDEYVELVRLLHQDLRGIDQVMWVQDSVGVSSLIALAWEDMYMAPSARLTGFRGFYEMMLETGDEDVAQKHVGAMIAYIAGFLERGNRAIELAHAMSNPNWKLSASWRGRDVTWHLDTSGQYIINNSDERTVQFNAKTAEDFGVSSGTAESLDDLALLLGYREYRVIEGRADQYVRNYVENWRRALDTARSEVADYEYNMRRGDIRSLGAARNNMERILSQMRRYPAVEIRLVREFGINIAAAERALDDLRERIRDSRRSERGGRGGRGR